MKKFKLFLLSTILCLGSASSLVSCQTITSKECTHEETRVDYIEATCTTPKIKRTVCTKCFKYLSEEEVGEALGHDYVSEVTSPTKYDRGYTHHSCTRCNDSYDDTYTSSLMTESQNGLEAILKYIKDRLKDPDSMLYEATCYSSADFNDKTTKKELPGYFLYDVNYNAKNGFGAYTGYKHLYFGWNTRYRSVATADYLYYVVYQYEFYFTKSNK